MKLSLLKLPHTWPRDIAQYNRSHRVLFLFEIQKLGVSKVTLETFGERMVTLLTYGFMICGGRSRRIGFFLLLLGHFLKLP